MALSSLLAAASVVHVGGYVSIGKSIALVAILLIWARLLTWVDKDAEAAFLPRVPINLGLMAGFALGIALFFFMPGFFVALPVVIVLMIIESAVYLSIRNSKVGLKDLGEQFRVWIGGFKPKSSSDTGSAKGDTLLTGKNGKAVEAPENENGILDRTGFEALQQIFTDPLRKGATRIEVEAGEQSSKSRYFVDGVGYEGAPITKTDAAKGFVLLKEAMGLDTTDKRKPQVGAMKAVIDKQKHELRVVTAGSTAGESLVVDIDVKKQFEHKLDNLGFSSEQLTLIRAMIAEPTGIVLLAAPKGQGLTSLEYAILRAHDAFLTHIQTVERMPEIELEGITQNSIPTNATPAEENKQVGWVVSQEPEVIMAGRLEDSKSAIDIVKYAGNGKRAYIGLRAGSTFEAIEIWRKLVGDDKLAMKNLRMVICGRVIRKLCEACKIDYSPDPATMRKLGLSPEKVGKLFTARTSPLKDAKGNTVVCDFCLDLRFRGRVGMFEVFEVDNEVRSLVLEGGTVNQLKMQFKKQKSRYLQEQALDKAVAGETSLQEVARVLKVGTEGSSGGKPPTSGGRPPSSGGRSPTSGPKPSSSPSSSPRSTSSRPSGNAPTSVKPSSSAPRTSSTPRAPQG